MRKTFFICAASALALAACSERSDNDAASESVMDYAAEEMAADTSVEAMTDAAGSGALPDLASLEVALPKLAYVYDFAFRLPGEDIGKLQRRHADLCEQQGPTSCQIVGMSKSGEEADHVTGELQLAVATRQARAFGALLEKEAADSGAEQVSAEISAEELSKQIVDTEAHLRARIQLRDRLMEVLRTLKGDVRELVEAERSVAQVNQEIDRARSWLKEMRGRVAFSRMTVRYDTAQPAANAFLGPIESVAGSMGAILGYVIAALLAFAAIVFPVGAVVMLGRAINRRFARLAA